MKLRRILLPLPVVLGMTALAGCGGEKEVQSQDPLTVAQTKERVLDLHFMLQQQQATVKKLEQRVQELEAQVTQLKAAAAKERR
jgi:TolA-binding protein